MFYFPLTQNGLCFLYRQLFSAVVAFSSADSNFRWVSCAALCNILHFKSVHPLSPPCLLSLVTLVTHCHTVCPVTSFHIQTLEPLDCITLISWFCLILKLLLKFSRHVKCCIRPCCLSSADACDYRMQWHLSRCFFIVIETAKSFSEAVTAPQHCVTAPPCGWPSPFALFSICRTRLPKTRPCRTWQRCRLHRSSPRVL